MIIVENDPFFSVILIIDIVFILPLEIIGTITACIMLLGQYCQTNGAKNNEKSAKVIGPEHETLEVKDVKHEREHDCDVCEWNKCV